MLAQAMLHVCWCQTVAFQLAGSIKKWEGQSSKDKISGASSVDAACYGTPFDKWIILDSGMNLLAWRTVPSKLGEGPCCARKAR